MFSQIFRSIQHSKIVCVQRMKREHIGTFSWVDKLFVNHLKLPKFMRIHGPTGEEVTKDLDLTGKTCLITGGTSGIGKEIVRCLMAKNCNILMACRNPYAANIAASNIWGDSTRLSTYEMNFASFGNVKKGCEEILKDAPKIDIVILNAAVFGMPWTLTEDGFETTFQVNYLSQFYLLVNIENLLAPDARVVFMSSESHRNTKWSLPDTLSPTKDLISIPKEVYTSIKAYNISKLCGIFAMHYLGHRWRLGEKSVFCAHPGSFVKTNLCTNWWVYEALYSSFSPFTKSIAQAAATPLYCATSSELQGLSDLYFKDCRECAPSYMAQDNHLAFKIVDLSRELIEDAVGFIEDKEVDKELEFEEEPEHVKSKPDKSAMEEPILTA